MRNTTPNWCGIQFSSKGACWPTKQHVLITSDVLIMHLCRIQWYMYAFTGKHCCCAPNDILTPYRLAYQHSNIKLSLVSSDSCKATLFRKRLFFKTVTEMFLCPTRKTETEKLWRSCQWDRTKKKWQRHWIQKVMGDRKGEEELRKFPPSHPLLASKQQQQQQQPPPPPSQKKPLNVIGKGRLTVLPYTLPKARLANRTRFPYTWERSLWLSGTRRQISKVGML